MVREEGKKGKGGATIKMNMKDAAAMEADVEAAADPFLKCDPWSRGESDDHSRHDLLRKKLHGKNGRGGEEQSAGWLPYDPKLKMTNPYKERYADAADPFYLGTVGQRRPGQQHQRQPPSVTTRRSEPRPPEAAKQVGGRGDFLHVQPQGQGPRWADDGPADPPARSPCASWETRA